MKNLFQKLTASFALGALLVVASGFCYGLTAKAAMADMHASETSLASQPCHGEHKVAVKKSAPLSNAVMPCCIDRHDNAASTQILNFSGVTKIVAVQNTDVLANSVLFFENNLKTSSDSSPPKPDKLASVLRLE